MLYRQATKEAPMFQARSILVPVDFSEFSERALRYAIWLGKQLGASVSLVHVYPIAVYAAPPMLGASVPMGNFREQAQKALEELMERVGKDTDAKLQGQTCEGVAHREIQRVAQEQGADLIVMGTHGRSGLEKLLMGSVAERVIRTSHVPVIAVPRDH
jgi:nucleotide-binding universal stress UspA family protein